MREKLAEMMPAQPKARCWQQADEAAFRQRLGLSGLTPIVNAPSCMRWGSAGAAREELRGGHNGGSNVVSKSGRWLRAGGLRDLKYLFFRERFQKFCFLLWYFPTLWHELQYPKSLITSKSCLWATGIFWIPLKSVWVTNEFRWSLLPLSLFKSNHCYISQRKTVSTASKQYSDCVSAKLPLILAAVYCIYSHQPLSNEILTIQ